MPLNPSVLSDELIARVFNNPSPELEAVAQGWADAYGVFAADATACGSPPAAGAIDAAVTRLQSSLVLAFVGIDPTTTALGMQTAFQLFWTGFAFSGSAVVVPGTPTLADLLVNLWTANPLVSSKSVAANLHATVLAAWSLTVTVGPPCSSPIV